MRAFVLAIAAVAAALLFACGSTPNGHLHFELAFDGDPVAVAERVRERLAVVDEREDVTLGEVQLRQNAKSGLDVDITVAGGPRCERFEAARRGVRAALEKAQQLSLREVLDVDEAFTAAVKAAIGDHGAVRPEPGQAYLVVEPDPGADVAALLAGHTTAAADLALEIAEDYSGGVPSGHTYRVWPLAKTPGLRDGDIEQAKVAYDQMNLPIVQVSLTAAGAQRFEALTARLTDRFLAILVDGEVMSVPKVMEPIRGGRLQVSMGMGGRPPAEVLAEAELLAHGLRAGPIAKHVAIKAESATCEPGG